MTEEIKALWVSPEVHKKAKVLAAKYGLTINQLIEILLKGNYPSNIVIKE